MVCQFVFTSSVLAFLLLCIFIVALKFFDLVGMKWNFIVASVCVSLITTEI